jgi:hypothetical protein
MEITSCGFWMGRKIDPETLDRNKTQQLQVIAYAFSFSVSFCHADRWETDVF